MPELTIKTVPEPVAAALTSDPPATAMLLLICAIASDLVADLVSATVSRTVGDTFETAVASSDLGRALDVVQYELGDGPCLQAMRTGQPHTLNELGDGRLAAAARQVGVGGVVSFPIGTDGSKASLNLYVTSLDQIDLTQAAALAGYGAAVMGAVRQPPWPASGVDSREADRMVIDADGALEGGRMAAGLPLNDLHLAYLTLGGASSLDHVRQVLAGHTSTTAHDLDILAQAINEALIDLGDLRRVPYANDFPSVT